MAHSTIANSTIDHGAIGHSTIDGGENPEGFASLVVLDARGRGLELAFWVRAERCLHRLTAIDGTRRECLLESVEGASDDLWPPSPPWQQVSATPGVDLPSPRQAGTQQHATLLVGAAGASHWSASVEGISAERCPGVARPGLNSIGPDSIGLDEVGHPAGPGLRFDVACRAKSRPDRLGSTYRIADATRVVSGDMVIGETFSGQSALDLRTDLGLYQLRVLPLESAPFDICQLSMADGVVRIVAPTARFDQEPTTFRWRYQVSLAD